MKTIATILITDSFDLHDLNMKGNEGVMTVQYGNAEMIRKHMERYETPIAKLRLDLRMHIKTSLRPYFQGEINRFEGEVKKVLDSPFDGAFQANDTIILVDRDMLNRGPLPLECWIIHFTRVSTAQSGW